MAVLAARAAGPYRAGRRPAVVVTLHNLPIGSTRVRFAGAALARIVGRAEAVLAVSDDIIAWLSARRLRAGRPARAAARAPAEWTPVPAPDLGLPQRTAASVKGELGLAPSDRLILTVARLAPQKGLDLAVATAQAIAEASPTWPFLWVIAGEGPARGRLEALIAATGVPVRLLGRRDDLPDLYHAADLVVGTSHWEGQPLALQEALKAGAPIVATGRGGVGALIGRGGKLVARNRLVLRDAIVQLLDDPESLADLRKQAKLRGRELSRAADALAAVTAVYSRVLGGDC
jgi:glycosyltransferase involved in cell wall biosynthesis